ncbi:MAG: efflux RND transporter permease subunit [Cyanobacteriota bacterium]
MDLSPLIRRPVATLMLMLALVLWGAVGFLQLPISDLPTIDVPTLQVNAALPGANPETMATAVATPLEQAFTSIAGLSTMSSSSSQGSSQINLQFDLNRDSDAAAQDVQTAISQASRLLPPEMPRTPSVRKVNPTEQPMFYLVLSSDLLPLSEVTHVAQVELSQRLSRIGGVSQVQVYGAQNEAVRIRIDPQALRTKGIGLDEIGAAIKAGNANLPTGNLYGPTRTFSLQDTTRMDRAAPYRQLVIAVHQGSPVRLGDVAEVTDGVENERLASWYNGSRSIVVAIQRQPGSNIVSIAQAIRRQLPELRKQIPGAITMDVLFDRSESIQEAIHDVELTLLLTIALVVGVVALFLGTGISTLLPSLAIVISLLATFGAMQLLGYSLDTISLMALTLSVGFVVDDAIVMVEAIVQRQEEGNSRWQAALRGSREIGPTILSMTVSLVAVFIPILFLGGLLGRLFREFAVTLSLAILFSGLVALTLTPMLAARLLPPPDPSRASGGVVLQAFERGFQRLKQAYARTLASALQRPNPVQAVSAGLLLLAMLLFVVVPKGFIPEADTGQLTVITQAAEGTSSAEMARLQGELSRRAARHPAVEGVNSTIGSGGPNASANAGRLFLKLKPRSQRSADAQSVQRQLRRRLSGVPGIRAFVKLPPAINVGTSSGRAQYQFTVSGSRFETLLAEAPDFEAHLKALPGLLDVSSDLLPNNPTLAIRVDHDRAATLGVDATRVQNALRQAYGDTQVSTIYREDGQVPVIAGVDLEHQDDPTDLRRLSIRSDRGLLVPLDAIAEIEQSEGVVTINHSGQQPAVTFSFNLRAGTSLATATERIRDLAAKDLSSTLQGSFQGTAKLFEESLSGLPLLLGAAVVVIYGVLGILYEDPIHPLTILTSLPAAAVGGLLALQWFGSELNVYSSIGLILLIGIVKKNGIMMVDAAIANRRRGLSVIDAIQTASLLRFRPIMMTTVAALIGTLPIALGLGASAESRRPLGLVVLGGLLLSQLVTLYITPVFYLQAERLAARLGLRPQDQRNPPPAD